MMKKSSLTTAIVAGIAGTAGLVANAVNINPDGLGQVLIYPYYTVNNGQNTLISVVNTTNDVKAVKVRFLEGRNSQEVLDFNLYMSPFDVWTGAVIDNGVSNGPARLITSDTSCTAPAIPVTGADGGPGEPFKNFQYASHINDGGPFGLERTREGHLEMIEMGRVVDSGDVDPAGGVSVEAVDPAAVDTAASIRHATWATHVNGVPNNCAAIRNSWLSGGTWFTDATRDIDEPNGGLFGGVSIINVAQGTNLSYNADAIDGFYLVPPASSALLSGALHAAPGTTDPALDQALTDDVNQTAEARIFDNGTLITMTFDTGTPDAVSAVFMHDAIFNEYVTNPSLGAQSEWVVTFPTKLLHLLKVAGVTPGGRLPFTQINQAADSAADVVLAYRGNASGVPVGACEPIDISFYDREEGKPGDIPSDLIFSPPPPDVTAPGLNLCYEAQVITFNQPTAGETLVAGNTASAVLGSRYPRNINLCQVYNADGTCGASGDVFNAGWLRMDMGDADNYLDELDVDLDGFWNRAKGLPVTGFWAANYINANVQPGILSNYSQLAKHRGSRDGVTVTLSGNTVVETGFSWS